MDRTAGAALASRLLTLVVLLGGSTAAFADQWLVYLGGGVASLEGGWTEKRGQVRFTNRGGVLVSVPAHDVDLAASSFISWQLDGRMREPPRTGLSEVAEESGTQAPCVPAKILHLRSSETIEVATEGGSEVIHLACLDAPETEHREAELAWFGRASLSAMEIEAKAGAAACLTEHSPPRRDAEGHRLLHVTLADGRDYTAAAIGSGFGLLRPGLCDRAHHYRGIENRAIADQRGLWSPRAEKAALAAVGHSVSLEAGVATALPPRRRTGGG